MEGQNVALVATFRPGSVERVSGEKYTTRATITYPNGQVSIITITDKDQDRVYRMKACIDKIFKEHSSSITSTNQLNELILLEIKREKATPSYDKKRNIETLNLFLKCISQDASRVERNVDFIYAVKGIASQRMIQHGTRFKHDDASVEAASVLYSVFGIRELQKVLDNVTRNPSQEAWGEFYAKVCLYNEKGPEGVNLLKTHLPPDDLYRLQQALGRGMNLFEEYASTSTGEGGPIGISTTRGPRNAVIEGMVEQLRILHEAIGKVPPPKSTPLPHWME